MRSVPCTCYDGQTSRRWPAMLAITADGDVIVAMEGVDSRRLHRLSEVHIPHRVADTPRYVRLPDGAVCEVRDNDTLDAMHEDAERGTASRGRRFGWFVHRLDSSWRGALAALAVTVAIVYSYTEWGTQAIATLAVAMTPPEAEAAVGDHVLAFLEQFDLLEPSELDQNRRNELLAAFEKMKRDTGVETADLHFRAAPGIGANAFALPGGAVFLTDELVELAEHEEEVLAVLAHELGHVEGRHVLRRLARTSSMLVIWTVFTGDPAAALLSFVAPDRLLAQRYSRAFEREADAFAADYLLQAGISPTRLGDILHRLDEAHGGDGASTWLDSHPGAKDRAADAAAAVDAAAAAALHGTPRGTTPGRTNAEADAGPNDAEADK